MTSRPDPARAVGAELAPRPDGPIGDVLAVLGRTRTVGDAARELGTSPATLTALGRKYPQIEQALRNQSQEWEDTLARSLTEFRGNLSRVAEALGLGTPAAVRYYVQRSPRLRAHWEGLRERVVDQAEENIFAAVDGGDLKMSWRILTTLGKDRGYTERREVDARVVHQVDGLPSAQIVRMLDSASYDDPEVVEAEMSSLDEGDRRMLQSALERAAG